MSKPVPILYYHSVADHEQEGLWTFLSCPVKVFEKQMAWLAKNGWYGCHWDELKDHLDGTKALPDKSVMLHFDDGFLDNWTIAHPILEKYNLKYSVLATPDFIWKAGGRRQEVGNNSDWGYLSEKQIKAMADSGLADFQAHGYTHTWYPKSDKVVDVFDGSQRTPHLMWNIFPEGKPEWLQRWPAGVLEGYPVFEFEKSLANERAFIPSDDFVRLAVQRFDKEKSKAENLAELQKLSDEYRAKGKLGRYETDEERLARIEKELLGTKKELEAITGKPVEHLVYPGGGHSEETDRLAFEYGYKLLSKGTTPNAFGSKLRNVQRFTGYYPFKPKALSFMLNMLLIRFQLARGQGNRFVHGFINTAKRFL